MSKNSLHSTKSSKKGEQSPDEQQKRIHEAMLRVMELKARNLKLGLRLVQEIKKYKKKHAGKIKRLLQEQKGKK